MSKHFTEIQLDALRELANIGSGTASTSLSGMLGRSVDISVPAAAALTFADAIGLCTLLGVDADSEMGQSALAEIGNIVGTSYINALAQMTGLELEPSPPQSATDMLGAIVASVLAGVAGAEDVALILDSDLEVEGEDCSLSFLMLPTRDGVEELLGRLGLGS